MLGAGKTGYPIELQQRKENATAALSETAEERTTSPSGPVKHANGSRSSSRICEQGKCPLVEMTGLLGLSHHFEAILQQDEQSCRARRSPKRYTVDWAA
jgi:hypothetical protein